MYTKLVENHQTGFLVLLFRWFPCSVSHPPPIQCVAGMDLSEPGGQKGSHTPSASCPPCSSAQTMRRGSQPWVCGFSALKGLEEARPLSAWVRGCLWPKWLFLLSPCSSPCQMAVPSLLWSPSPSLQSPSNGCHSHFSGCNHLFPWGLFCARSLNW